MAVMCSLSRAMTSVGGMCSVSPVKPRISQKRTVDGLQLAAELEVEIAADHGLGHGLVADLLEDVAIGVALLEAGGHFVEGFGKFADFVMGAHGEAGVETALADGAGGPGQLADGHGEAARKEPRDGESEDEGGGADAAAAQPQLGEIAFQRGEGKGADLIRRARRCGRPAASSRRPGGGRHRVSPRRKDGL